MKWREKLSPKAAEPKQGQVEPHMEEPQGLYVSSSPVGVYVVQNRKFRFTNPQFQKYTDFSQDELLQMDSLSLVYPEDRETVRENAVKMLKGERISPYEFRIITKGRRIRWMMEAVRPIQYRKGQAALGSCMDITEFTEANTRLKELETLQSSVLGAIPSSVLVLHNRRIVFANDTVHAILGWKAEELIGKTIEVLFRPEEEYKEIRGRVDSMLEQQAVFTEEIPCRRKDGRDIVCLMTGSRIGESLKENRIVATFEDISERKKTDEELHKQRGELNSRLKELNCLYTIANLTQDENISLEEIAKGIVSLIPMAFQDPQHICSRLTLKGQEFRTGNYQEAIHKQARDIIVDGKRVGTLEIRFLGETAKPGQISFPEEETNLMNTIVGQLGELLRYKGAQQMLRNTEANLRHIITNNADGMIVVDGNGIVRYVNPAAEALFGRKTEELVGESFGYPVLAGEKTEVDIVSKGEEAITAEMRMVEIEWDGKSACLASLRDITERKRIEDIKSDLVSLVSDQLRTPVEEIEGHLDQMLTGLTGDLTAKQKRHLKEMQELSSQSLRVISNLLDMSAIERGVISLDIRPVELKKIVDLAIRGYDKRIKEKGLVLNLEEMDTEITVLADRDKMVEALRNLIDNAVKLTDEGSITIKTKGEKGFGIVEVADTGKGMSQDILDKLFGKEQIPGSSLISKNGFEPGLHVARKFIELQRGDISASSTIGRGSRFVLRIPSAKFETPIAKG